MADIFLIVVTVVAFVLLLVVGFYLLVHYSHPDDKNDAYFPKLVVLFGFVLAGATVLLLPLDVANNAGYAGCDGYDTKLCGGINMQLFWDIIFWIIPAWVFVLIPFSTFYYEADDGMLMAGTSIGGTPKSRLCQALCSQIAVLIIVGLLFGLTYLFLSDTDIPVEEYTGGSVASALSKGTYYTTSVTNGNFSTSELQDIGSSDLALLQLVNNTGSMDITLQVGLATFFAGLMAFLGWFFFAVFAGIGLTAMPLDLILAYTNRTRVLGAVELAEAKLELQERVNTIVDIGEQLQIERQDRERTGRPVASGFGAVFKYSSVERKEAQLEQKTMREFQNAVFQLEQDVEDFEACTDSADKYNPLIPYAALFLGICSFIISAAWVIQMVVYVFPDPPLTPFLNTYFQWFDGWFPLFGVLSVAIFTVYLLFCAVKGCFKFGLRFLLLTIHPMKPNRTYMSSFLFNIGLVLLCAMPLVQFAQDAFSDYARFATIRQIFGVQVQYLQFFSYFWTNNVFSYALLAIAFLTALYLGCKRSDKNAANDALRARVKSRRD